MTSVREVKRLNMVAWLEGEAARLGTEAQSAAYSRNALPEIELLSLARCELFKVFAGNRWQPLRWQDCPHIGCSTPGKVRISSAPWPYDRPPVLAGWTCGENDKAPHDASYETLRRQMAEVANLEWVKRCPSIVPMMGIHVHTAKCDICHGFIKRASALISVPWAGRMLSREYAL